MVASCGQDEPNKSPKKVNFSCIIGFNLMSFFYDHPVFFLVTIDNWSISVDDINNRTEYKNVCYCPDPEIVEDEEQVNVKFLYFFSITFD